MKILTLWEPYATLIALGEKKIETRSWYTSYRGPMAIHAAKHGYKNYWYPAKMAGTLHHFEQALDAAATRSIRIQGHETKPGHIVAVAEVLDCLPMEGYRCQSGLFEDYPLLDTPKERAFGDYSSGRYGWVLEHVFRLPEPIPYKGGQGLRDLSNEIVKQIKVQGWQEPRA